MDAVIKKLPDTLYFPPGEWGDCSQLMTVAEVKEFLAWAKTQGEEWSGVSLADAEECGLIRAITSTIGLYEGGIHHDGYFSNCRRYGYVIGMNDGSFRMVAQLNTVEECIDSEYTD